jgi:hypothetical protein
MLVSRAHQQENSQVKSKAARLAAKGSSL